MHNTHIHTNVGADPIIETSALLRIKMGGWGEKYVYNVIIE